MKIIPFQEINDEIRLDEKDEKPLREAGPVEPIEVESAAESESNEIINEILEEHNIKGTAVGDNSPNAKLKSFLDQCGGSLERVAINIADVMNRGETEAARLKAAEFISKMHGVQVELEEESKTNNKQAINININGTEINAMMNFFMPKS